MPRKVTATTTTDPTAPTPTQTAKPKKARTATVLTNAERQARWRKKRDARLHELEAQLAGHPVPTGHPTPSPSGVTPRPAPSVFKLRPAPPPTDAESKDELLTRLRKGEEHLVWELERLAINPGLDRAELATIADRFTGWKKRVLAAGTPPKGKRR